MNWWLLVLEMNKLLVPFGQHKRCVCVRGCYTKWGEPRCLRLSKKKRLKRFRKSSFSQWIILYYVLLLSPTCPLNFVSLVLKLDLTLDLELLSISCINIVLNLILINKTVKWIMYQCVAWKSHSFTTV